MKIGYQKYIIVLLTIVLSIVLMESQLLGQSKSGIEGDVERFLNKELKKETNEYTQKGTKYLRSLEKQVLPSGKHGQNLKKQYALIYKTLHKEHANRLIDSYAKGLEQTKKISGVRLSPDVEVFGWHPHWLRNAHRNYNYNLLSTIAYFSYDINPQKGTPRSQEPIRDWRTTDMIDTAHANGCKVLLTITCFGYTKNKTFLENANNQQEVLIDSLIDLISFRNADGVSVDFEAIPRDNKKQFTDFVRKLRVALDKERDGLIISVALPAVDHNKVFDIRALNKEVQQFVMMGYDYHGSFLPKQMGPVAPLYLGNNSQQRRALDLSNSVDAYLENGVPHGKLIVALPYYGLIWRSKSPDMSNATFDDHLSYRQIQRLMASKYTVRYDSVQNSAYLYYNDSSYYYKVWFDNKKSLDNKYKWIKSEGIRGTGIWALGYDSGETELWEAISDNFTSTAMGSIGGRRTPTIGNFLIRYQAFVVVITSMLLGFITIGFVRGFFDWRVREVFFERKIIRMLFGLLVLGLTAILMIWTGFFETRYWILLIGIFLGVLGHYVLGYILGFSRAHIP